MSSVATGHQRIFISYRREEASGHAGRIYDAMVARFGEDNVFMDVDIAPGVDFVDHITNVVSSCTVLIAVMGKSWAEAPGADGRPRLQDEADFVRLEVGTAVQNPDVTVIPALVDKARMPRAEQLPPEMRPLARRNALELSDGRWRYDVGRLNDTLEQLLAGLTDFPVIVDPEPPTPEQGAPTPTPVTTEPTQAVERRPYSLAEGTRLVVEGTAVAAVAGYLGRTLGDLVGDPKTSDLIEVASVVGTRTVTWGLVGIALAVWLALRTKRSDVARCALLGLVVGIVAGAVSGVIFAIPVKLPPENLKGAAKENWEVVALAVSGALIGGLLGTLWRRPQLLAGIGTGFVAGLLFQALLNNREWNAKHMPGLANAFGARAGVIAGATLTALLALDYLSERSLSRSSSSARAPAGR